MNKKIKTLIFVLLLALSYRFISSFTTTVIIGMKVLDSTTRGIEITTDMATSYFSDNSNIIGLVGISANILFIWFMFYAKQVKFNSYIRFKKIDSKLIVRLVCYSLVLQQVSIWANEIVHLFVPLDEYMEEMLTATTSDNLMFTLFVVGILAPLVEEIFFRGIIFTKLKNKIDLKLAILIQAILFSFIHLNPAQYFSCLLLGILAACYYEKCDSMIAPIILHVSFNSIAVIATDMPDNFNIVYYLMLVISMIYLSYYYYKKRQFL